MAQKKEKKINLDKLTEEEKMKYEIAGELGLLDRVLNNGWKSLSSKETGRIGGWLTEGDRRRKSPKAGIKYKNSYHILSNRFTKMLICVNSSRQLLKFT